MHSMQSWKGSDIGTVDPRGRALVSFFHPRRQRWDDHFLPQAPSSSHSHPEGKETARLLKLNLDKRVAKRLLLMAVGRYPR